MTTSPPSCDEQLLVLLPATRYRPAGFTSSLHCNAGTSYRIRNMIATRLTTSSHDCWTIEPAPAEVDEAEWTILSIGSNPDGGAVFYRGHVIERYLRSSFPNGRTELCIERASLGDYEGLESDLLPMKDEGLRLRRYLADGSMTVIYHPT